MDIHFVESSLALSPASCVDVPGEGAQLSPQLSPPGSRPLGNSAEGGKPPYVILRSALASASTAWDVGERTLMARCITVVLRCLPWPGCLDVRTATHGRSSTFGMDLKVAVVNLSGIQAFLPE